MNAALDHLVINARFELDAAQAIFAGLGFTLTPRGHHSLGSINHLIMFEEGYLELIGLPKDGERLRQEILDSSLGIDGLVLASDDPQQTREALIDQGFEAQPVQHFSRPVHIKGVPHDARFGTVRLVPGQFAAGRVYFCHHQTPELVWRPEWLGHANGAQGIERLTVVSAQPSSARLAFERLALAASGQGGTRVADQAASPELQSRRFHVEVLDAQGWEQRAGAQAAFSGERAERFVSIGLRGDDFDQLAQRAERLQLPSRREERRLIIAIPALDTVLEFLR